VRYTFSVLILIASISSMGFGQMKEKRSGQNRKKSKVIAIEKCAENSESLYNRQQVLEQLAETLNNTATHYHNAMYLNKQEQNIASAEDGLPIGFTIYDLTDETNIGMLFDKCIEFKNRHVYHFSLIFTPYSFSHILVLEDGKLKVFKGINCEKGDHLEDVLNYLSQKLKDEDKEAIMNRVKNYREFGIYAATDDHALRCQEVKAIRK
jgi:hypothetical protein